MERTGKADKTGFKAVSLATGEACKAVFRPTSCFKEGTVDSSKISGEGTLIFVSIWYPNSAKNPQRPLYDS